MKCKFSLVALAALGVFSGANAGALADAIKGVDVSGYVFWRYDNTKTDTKKEKNTVAYDRIKSDVNFKAAIDDNFFGVIGFRYDNRDISGDSVKGGISGVKSGANGFDGYSTHSEFNVRQFFIGYKDGGTTLQIGRQQVGAFFTHDMVGTGFKLMNKDVDGLTLAVMGFDALENDAHIGTARLKALGASTKGGDVTKLNKSATYQHNLYGAAAIGSYDPVKFQLWYAYLDKISALYAVDFKFDEKTDDVKFSLQAQFAGSVLDSKFKKNLRNGGTNDIADNAIYYGVKAGLGVAGMGFSAGYLDFSTKEDKLSLVNYEYNSGLIVAGEEILDMERTFFAGKNKYAFVTAAYKFDALKFSADYVWGDNKNKVGKTNSDKLKRSEIVGRIAYGYSKKLTFLTWYSHIDEKIGGNNTKIDHVRAQARYAF